MAIIKAILALVDAFLRYWQWPRLIRTIVSYTYVERKVTNVQAELQVSAPQSFTRGRRGQQEEKTDPRPDLEQEVREKAGDFVRFVLGVGRYLFWLMHVCVHTLAYTYA